MIELTTQEFIYLGVGIFVLFVFSSAAIIFENKKPFNSSIDNIFGNSL